MSSKYPKKKLLPHQLQEICEGKKKTCGAKLRKKEVRCKSPFIMENGRCRLHGGATPKGKDSPHFKTGEYSKYLRLPPLLSEPHTGNTIKDSLRKLVDLYNSQQTKWCGAKLRNKDKTCRNTFVMKNGRCRLHGGKSPSGFAHPHYIDGRYSNHPVDKFMWKYRK